MIQGEGGGRAFKIPSGSSHQLPTDLHFQDPVLPLSCSTSILTCFNSVVDWLSKQNGQKRCCRDSQVFCFTRNLHLGRPTTKPGVLRRWEAAKEGTLAHTCSTAEPPFARRRSVTVSVLEASNPKLHDRIAFTKGSSCGFLEEKRQKLPVASDRSVRSNGHVRNAAPFASLPPLRTMPRSSETRTKDRLDESTTGTERGGRSRLRPDGRPSGSIFGTSSRAGANIRNTKQNEPKSKDGHAGSIRNGGDE